MWTWQISTGALLFAESIVGYGYSGHGDGVNNVKAEAIQKVGPLPEGWYTIGAAYNSAKLGPTVMDLTPDEANDMHGRSLFRIHGDNAAQNQTASEGCIILPMYIRRKVAQSSFRRLHVVA